MGHAFYYNPVKQQLLEAFKEKAQVVILNCGQTFRPIPEMSQLGDGDVVTLFLTQV